MDDDPFTRENLFSIKTGPQTLFKLSGPNYSPAGEQVPVDGAITSPRSD